MGLTATLEGVFGLRCVGYVRVSSREQDEGVQRRAIEEFAESRGIELVEVYVDKGVSGARKFRDRLGAKRLLDELDSLDVECIICWSLDRLGRSMLDTMNTVLELERRGVKVITVKEEWLQTLDENIRKLILSILAWFAEYERRRIRERQLEAWAQGKQKGRPPKITDKELIRYLKRYPGLSKKALWKILRADGYDIGYYQLVRRINRLLGKGVVKVRVNLDKVERSKSSET